MTILIKNLQRLHAVNTSLLRAQLAAMLRALPLPPSSASPDVGLTLISSPRMRALHAHHLALHYATDILSFPTCDAPLPPPGPDTLFLSAPRDDLGDIVVCVDVVSRVARRNAWTLDEYLPVVAAHGLAHLAGFTHAAEGEYAEMREVEVGLLAALRAGEKRCTRRGAMEGGLPESYLP